MRWREGAPDYVADILDNKGQTADRYTVNFAYPFADTNGDVMHLDMSDAPTHPCGVSMWGSLRPHEASAYRYRCGHHRIRWLDLPENIREHVVARAAE
jgi:hypothetical protein